MAKRHAIHNLPETHVAYRFNPHSMTAMARDGYAARKLPKILDNMREILRWDDPPRPSVERWLENPGDAVDLIERCDARFTSLHGDNDEVAERTAQLLMRALRKAPSLRLWLRLWLKIWRRHHKTAFRATV